MLSAARQPSRTPNVSHQTIKLSRGKHANPQQGACVMELASMLAGEPFSDHPISVCPVIGSLLRAYNDSIDDRRRQDLYACAAKVVGSRCSPEVQQRRAERLEAWSEQMLSRHPIRRRLRALLDAGRHRRRSIESLGPQAVRAIARHSDQTHVAVLALIDELLAMRDSRPPSRPPSRLVAAAQRD